MDEFQKKLILIIDSNKKNLNALKADLEDQYKIVSARTKKELDKALGGDEPDLVLLNVSSSYGLGFLREFEKNEAYRGIPVICLAMEDQYDEEVACFESGAMDFIREPYKNAVLQCRVLRAIELSEYKKSAQKVERYDTLTGLDNRSYGEKRIRELLAEGKKGAFFMIDLDNFKGINDAYGHLAGDDVLITFAGILKDLFGEHDVIVRLGGDEFMVFAMDNIQRIAIMEVAGQVFEKMTYAMDKAGYGRIVSVSMGIAIAPKDADNYETLYKYADKALYDVKRSGKDDYAFYNAEAQNEEDYDRLMDLTRIRYILEGRMDWRNNAFQVDYGDFKKIYDYIYRGIRRNGNEVQIILFTLKAVDEIESTDIEIAMARFEEAVLRSLRMVDVGTRYSKMQYIVILLDTNVDNGERVARRVEKNFAKLYEKKNIDIRYDIETMIPKIAN